MTNGAHGQQHQLSKKQRAQASAVSNSHAAATETAVHQGASAHVLEDVLCDNVLCLVLSWLDVRELLCTVLLVCKRWHVASNCTDVWRR